MMKTRRECQYRGHEGTDSQYICVFNECKVGNRWICSECLVELLHHHGNQKQDHVMKQKQFLDYIISQQELCKNDKEYQSLQELLKETEQLIQTLMMLKNQIITQINDYIQQKDFENIKILVRDDFFKLENSQIQKIINMNNKDYDQNLQNELLSKIKLQKQDINNIVKINEQKINKVQEKQIHNQIAVIPQQQNKQQEQQQIQQIQQNQQQHLQIKEEVNFQQQQAIKLTQSQIIIHQTNVQDTKYEYEHYFEYKQEFSILISQISQISQNGQYLVIGRLDNKLQVFDLRTKSQIVEFQSYNNNIVNICKFTLDQKYLLCCDDRGILSQYDISQNFQLKYANQIHQNWIKDLVFLDNHNIITCSVDKSIQMRNIQSNQQIRIIENAHDDIINSIDFDKENDIIFSCSKDNSIRLFKQSSGKILFKQENIHNRDLLQIKLISNNRLVSSNYYDLILWDVNYDKKMLKYIKLFNEFNYNFAYALDSKDIALICENVVKILDYDLNLIASIKHDVKNLSMYYKTVQQNQMNYLLIIGEQHLQILKRVGVTFKRQEMIQNKISLL